MEILVDGVKKFYSMAHVGCSFWTIFLVITTDDIHLVKKNNFSYDFGTTLGNQKLVMKNSEGGGKKICSVEYAVWNNFFLFPLDNNSHDNHR